MGKKVGPPWFAAVLGIVTVGVGCGVAAEDNGMPLSDVGGADREAGASRDAGGESFGGEAGSEAGFEDAGTSGGAGIGGGAGTGGGGGIHGGTGEDGGDTAPEVDAGQSLDAGSDDAGEDAGEADAGERIDSGEGGGGSRGDAGTEGGPCLPSGQLAPFGTPCDDDDRCNGAETCDGAGHCSAGSPLPLEDDNPCTLDACDPALGVSHSPAPVGSACSDGDLCNGSETCDGAEQCLAGTPPELNDGDASTLDSCDPLLGVTHTAVSAITPAVATTIANSTAFLYTGPGAPQTGGGPGAIDAARAAVIQGHIALHHARRAADDRRAELHP